MEYDDHDEEMEEELQIPPTYDSLGNSIRPRTSSTVAVGGGEVGSSGGRKVGGGYVRYRECLKNHAVGIGGHALDGCGEFMPAGEDGTLESLKCAACNCHRNFHRREMEGESSSMMTISIHQQHNNAAAASQFSPYNNYRTPPPPGYFHAAQQQHHHRPLALPAADTSGGGGSYSREEQEDMSNPSSSGGGGGSRSGSKKRHRTKFTPEQKEKMLGFAERLGWRIQKHDEDAVQQFCQETFIKRHVLKVWMHNNKHTLGKKP